MSEILISTSALPKADANLLHEAGIGWVRQGFPFPFSDRTGGRLAADYGRAREHAEAWTAKGFSVMGVTPLPFRSRHDPDENGKLRMKWRP